MIRMAVAEAMVGEEGTEVVDTVDGEGAGAEEDSDLGGSAGALHATRLFSCGPSGN